MPAPAPSIRIQVVDNLSTVLNSITQAANYHTNLSAASGGGGAHVWQPPLPTAAAFPYVIIAPMRETPAELGGNMQQQRHSLEVQVVALVSHTEESLTSGFHELEKLVCDIQRAVLIDPRRGQTGTQNVVIDTQLGPVEIKPRDEGDARLLATVEVTVRYRHQYGNPALVSGIPA